MEIKTAKIRTFSPLSLYNFYKIVLLIKSALVKENKRKIKKKTKVSFTLVSIFVTLVMGSFSKG
ncbi:hypothetical protein CUZ88_2797 [Enterococcus xinjiangensis]|nr:hypothetical protein [Enterococcus lactis]